MTGAPITVALIAAIFVLAGIIKGVTGMGLPTVAIGLLGSLMLPAEAAALLVIPSFITNVWQFASGPNRGRTIRRLWPMLAAAAVATWLASGIISGGDTTRIVVGLGIALIVYGLVGLSRVQIRAPEGARPWLSPLVGALTGIVTGATGVFVIPAGPYLQALGFEKEDLVQALGLSFTVSTIALAAGLATHGALQLHSAGLSVLCTLPALAGMYAGQWIRQKVDPATFRTIFFVGLVVLGGDLAVRALLH